MTEMQEGSKVARELVVSVTAVFDLAYVEAMYVDALTPDGGWSGTLNQYIKEFGDGVEKDMRGHMSDCRYESEWHLRALSSEDATRPLRVLQLHERRGSR